MSDTPTTDTPAIPEEAVTADGDQFPWAEDLDGNWHLRLPGTSWHNDRTDGANAQTACEQWIPSVHVSNSVPERRLCQACVTTLAAALPVALAARDRQLAQAVQMVKNCTGHPDTDLEPHSELIRKAREELAARDNETAALRAELNESRDLNRSFAREIADISKALGFSGDNAEPDPADILARINRLVAERAEYDASLRGEQ